MYVRINKFMYRKQVTCQQLDTVGYRSLVAKTKKSTTWQRLTHWRNLTIFTWRLLLELGCFLKVYDHLMSSYLQEQRAHILTPALSPECQLSPGVRQWYRKAIKIVQLTGITTHHAPLTRVPLAKNGSKYFVVGIWITSPAYDLLRPRTFNFIDLIWWITRDSQKW